MLNPNRVLLIHPLGYKADAAKRDVARMANIMPPIGLCSMAAYLEKHGIGADIIDCFARPDSDAAIIEYIRDKKPAIIGMSCTTSNFLDAVRIAKMCKTESPEVKTVIGGPHVSALKAKAIDKYPEVDIGAVGEGEETILELAQSASANALENIKGIVHRVHDAEMRFTGYREKGIELDTLPIPAYEKLAGYPDKYSLPIFNYPKTPNTSCISSRGCPYACSYCDRSVFGRSYRFNSAAYLYDHLKYLRERFDIRHINFYDDQFTFNRRRVQEFTDMMINSPLGMTYNCAVRAEHVDFDLLKRMKESGCWMISLGIETGDPDLLAQHRQNPNLDMLADKIRLIKKAGMRTKGLLMMGLPGESEASIRKSMKYVFDLPIDEFNLAKFTPYPGSPLYERIRELGEFNEDWANMDGLHFQFVPRGMRKERMQKLYAEFYRRHFSRPSVLWGYIAMVRNSPDSWIRLFKNLAGFARFAWNNERMAN